MSEKITGIVVSVVSAILTIAAVLLKEFTGLGNDKTYQVIFIVLVSVCVAVIIFFAILGGVKWRRLFKYRHNLVGISSVLERSKRVAKDINKVVKKVEKTIDNYIKNNDTLDEERKQQIKQVEKTLIGISKKNVGKAARDISYFKNVSARQAKGEIDKCKDSQSKILMLNEAVLRSINETNRALLVLEQYDVRIDLGDYVLKHSFVELQRAEALIDYKGWTYSLLGKTSKFKSSVEEGIQVINNYLNKKEDLDKKNTTKAIYLLARAYRHLGSDIVIAKKSPEEARLNNKRAQEVLERIDSDTLKNDQKMQEMLVGIQYGILNADYFDIHNRYKDGNKEQLVDEILPKIIEARGLVEASKDFPNPHRHLKCVLLENEFLKMLEPLLDENLIEKHKELLTDFFGESDNLRKTICDLFDNNTSIALEAFKRAIYADEMMETYINQEATQLFRIIKEIGNQ